jgi:hypothetical protein
MWQLGFSAQGRLRTELGLLTHQNPSISKCATTVGYMSKGENAIHPEIAAAFVVLGLGAWVTVNGVYQELPIIAETAPEGYDVFS